MDQAAQRYRERLADQVQLGVTRIGVNSGVAIVGNFGSEALLDYTAHGDAINIAARLKGANKYIGTRICVSAETARRMPAFHGRPIGKLWLKGKNQGTDTFEPLGSSAIQPIELDAYLLAYEQLATKQPDAIRSFEALYQRYPHDALIQFHLKRLRSGDQGTDIVLIDK